jgi:hypothetical protein
MGAKNGADCVCVNKQALVLQQKKLVNAFTCLLQNREEKVSIFFFHGGNALGSDIPIYLSVNLKCHQFLINSEILVESPLIAW